MRELGARQSKGKTRIPYSILGWQNELQPMVPVEKTQSKYGKQYGMFVIKSLKTGL